MRRPALIGKKLSIGRRPPYIVSMAKAHPRIERERKTLTAMIRIFCRDRHGTKGGLCNDCEGLLAYAVKRLDRCPFGAKKPACANCPIHCYRPDMREQVRAVMRHAGPRMIWRHPVLAACHLIDSRRKAQALCGPEDRAANKP
jgi:Nitrous oxide-stimulated promoter